MLQDRPLDNIAEKLAVNPNWSRWFTQLTSKVNYGTPPSQTLDLSASSQIPATSTNMRIQGSSAGTTELTSNPQIVTGFDGQKITLEGMSDTNIIKVIDGNGLQLQGGAPFEMGLGDTITLHYNKSRDLWIENYRSNN